MRFTRAEGRACEITNEQRENEARKGATRERETGTQRCDIEQVQVGANRAAKHQHSYATGSRSTATVPRIKYCGRERNARRLHTDSAETIKGVKSRERASFLFSNNYNI